MSLPRRFVVEADGGSRGNPGPAGYGAVVIDPDTGETLAETAEYIGVATNNVAEYRGLVAGLRAVGALLADGPVGTVVQVRVRMDSKLVVEQMSGRWKIKHPDMKPLAAEAAAVLPGADISYEWIPRERNKHADRLANEAMDAGRRGDRWDPSASTAALDTPRAPVAADPVTPQVGWGSAPDLGAPATLLLLRHGETALTPQKRFSGSGGTDPALSPAGLEQAERAATAFAALGTVEEIVSSPLRRCRETAGAVAARLGLEVRIEDGLRETDFGAWEGLTFGEVGERYGDDLDAWLASPDAAPTGGGESFTEVAERVSAARDALVTRYAGRTVLVVTHVTPIKTLVRLALGAPPEALFRMELSAASVSSVAYYADGNASVRLLNDTSHLR
ncbi:bifunctional RNase H/acid phosphatase [Streptomyces drozdowiczii]|uniref:Bifunctional RNase H/acid phosphatase n=1 Tax=Streptomyces drozdowiczii TaxID=202862 RepID=A0ABY6PXM7_9ACTN|nr:bifunctional RNase H/acid phosphatase [Streptomyces drozdowiczii]MCX0243591.1 bifunctional RNase H/acid phosphatase [Streptomyces drozdowiczii]UZK56509.1 bifunctional RNase H/acid phosphatase [Streptomyces drozdowiczii]